MTKVNKRRDIPYAQRILMEKFNTVREHRDDAARTALKIGCVALNNTENMGYIRIVRFAREQQKLTDEYYADPEVQEKHLNDRLRQMGFMVKDGRLLATMDENGELVKAAVDTPAPERKTQDLWNGWISVLDKLPEVFKPVILCRNTPDGYKVEQGMREVNGWWKVYGTRTKNVDWWMDLPNPPSGRK